MEYTHTEADQPISWLVFTHDDSELRWYYSVCRLLS